MGLSDRVYEMDGELFRAARQVLADCGCTDGCPSCVGPSADVGPDGKRIAMELLAELAGDRT